MDNRGGLIRTSPSEDGTHHAAAGTVPRAGARTAVACEGLLTAQLFACAVWARSGSGLSHMHGSSHSTGPTAQGPVVLSHNSIRPEPGAPA